MHGLSRRATLTTVVLFWLALAAFALGVLRMQGYWPRTFTGWLLILGPGAGLVILPYALANAGMLGLERFASMRWGDPRPGEWFRLKRMALLLGAATGAFLALLTVVAIVAATPGLRSIVASIGRHFQAVR